MEKPKIRWLVFLVPVALLTCVILASLFIGNSFSDTLSIINTAILSRFGWLYSLTTLAVLVICIVVCFLPFGKVRIGGPEARSRMDTKTIFAIVLCTIIGIGMVTWGTAEIMAHYTTPNEALDIVPKSDEAANYAMRTVLLHWTFPAYSLYALPSLLFAFAFYNMGCSFSISSFLCPLFGTKVTRTVAGIIDAVCIFTLLCGMIGTVGTAALSLLGGFSYLTDGQVKKGTIAIVVIIAALVTVFIISAITGVMKGIRFLSNLNLYIFIGLGFFVFIFGPTAFICNFGTEGVGNFIEHFFGDMLRTNAVTGNDWSYWWSIFYWAAYMAWAPISGMFIGKVCFGQTVRKIILITLVGPSVFTAIWMAIFSGTSMYFEKAGYGIADAYNKGYEYTAYAVFEHLPLTLVVVIIFLAVTFLSVVTACDSSTSALTDMVFAKKDSQEKDLEDAINEFDMNHEQRTSKGKKQETSATGRTFIKILFGFIIGLVAIIIVVFSDIQGVKMISTIGAFPALWIEIIVAVGVCKIAMHPARYDRHTGAGKDAPVRITTEVKDK
jgi:glycine betaine transporter